MSPTSNADQVEYWNGAAGQRWADKFSDTDRGLARIGAALLAFAGARPGEQVLDIGCGAGASTLELARKVKPKGTVTGIDISAPMLAVASRRAMENGEHIEFIKADATVHPFTPSYDLLFSRFGVMFFADPVATFANLKRALRQGGRFAFVCWRAFPENLWAYVPYKAAEPLLPPQEPSDPHAPGPFAFADAERVKSILTHAGFGNVTIETLDTTMNLGPTVEHAAKETLVFGPLSRAATDLPEDLRDRIKKVVEQRLQEFAGAEGVTPPAACWLVAARV